MLRRRRFREVIQRQLDVFAADEAALLEEGNVADAAWTSAGREESEEHFGDYQLLVDAVGERLYDIRESYAGTLDETTADDYRGAFNRAALKRFRRFASFLEEGE